MEYFLDKESLNKNYFKIVSFCIEVIAFIYALYFLIVINVNISPIGNAFLKYLSNGFIPLVLFCVLLVSLIPLIKYKKEYKWHLVLNLASLMILITYIILLAVKIIEYASVPIN